MFADTASRSTLQTSTYLVIQFISLNTFQDNCTAEQPSTIFTACFEPSSFRHTQLQFCPEIRHVNATVVCAALTPKHANKRDRESHHTYGRATSHEAKTIRPSLVDKPRVRPSNIWPFVMTCEKIKLTMYKASGRVSSLLRYTPLGQSLSFRNRHRLQPRKLNISFSKSYGLCQPPEYGLLSGL